MKVNNTLKEDKPKFCYSIIPDELITDKSLTTTERLGFGIIHKWSKHKTSITPVCTRSLKLLAEDLGVSERHMKRITKKLKAKGFLTNKRRYKKSSVIVLHMKRLKEDKTVENSQG